MRRPLTTLALWYAAFWALAAGLSLVIGWSWSMPVALAIEAVALIAWVRYTGPVPGESWCFVIKRGYRVRHIHWPRSGYTTCEKVKEMYEEEI